jgi:predicted peptidase
VDIPWPQFNSYDAVVRLPANYLASSTERFPLVISLHGRYGSVLDQTHQVPGGNQEGFIRQLWGTQLQSTYPAIVIAPDGHPKGMNPWSDSWWNDDMVARLIRDAVKFYRVDINRITVTGLSSGGAGTNDVATKYPAMFAGIMPVAFGPPGGSDAAYNVCMLKDLDIWAAGNQGDGVFQAYNWVRPDASGFRNKFNACPGVRGTLEVSIQPGDGHDGWDAFWSRPDVQQ